MIHANHKAHEKLQCISSMALKDMPGSVPIQARIQVMQLVDGYVQLQTPTSRTWDRYLCLEGKTTNNMRLQNSLNFVDDLGIKGKRKIIIKRWTYFFFHLKIKNLFWEHLKTFLPLVMVIHFTNMSSDITGISHLY